MNSFTDGLIATNDTNMAAGYIAYWRLSSDSINGSQLLNALARRDIDENAPGMPTPRVALRRAMQKQAGGSLFVRKGPNGSILLVEQDGDEFETFANAELNIGGQPVVTCPGSAALEEDVRDQYWAELDTLASTDISSWLIREAAACDALSLRDTGGVYFIPAHKMERWEKLCAALHETTKCRVHNIPAMHTDNAVGAILDALTEECAQFSQEMDAAMGDETLGARALRGRANKADAMIAKLQRYEDILGDKMSKISDQIQEQSANAIMLALTKEEN